MKFDIISISSDEDVPLNSLASPRTSLSPTACLKTHCVQQCEFCDEVFLDRYTALIHNAQHIIIPLLKQNVYQCMECLYYFTSQIELKHHRETKHEKEIANESDNNIKSEKLHMALSDIVKRELDVKLENYLIQNNLKSHVKIKEEINIKEEVIEENCVNETVDENVNSHISEAKFKISNRLQFEDDSDDNDINDETVLDDNVFKMVGNGLLNDLTTVCKVNINLYDKPWVKNVEDIKIETSANYVENGDIVPATVGNIAPSIVECKKVETSDNNVNNGVIVGATKVENIEASIVEYAPSIHFEDLIKPGMYRCRRCSYSFPTRFQLIQHDMSHVKIRKSRPLLCIYCERFISNTRALLKKHVDEHHNTECSPRPNQLPNCKKCGLKYYNYSKHTKNYHVPLLRSEMEGHAPKKWRPVTFCNWCNRAFYSEEEKLTHINTKHLVEKKCQQCGMVSTAVEIQEHQKTCKPSVFLDNFNALSEPLCYNATLKLCGTCCLFLKSKTQYTIVKSVSEEGVRLTCEQCGKQYFELKLVVRRMVVLKKKEKHAEKERKKYLSNRERLKNIQQRLKMINKLSRY